MSFKRWPIIRHIRYFYLRTRFNWWWNTQASLLFICPNQSDLDYLQAVWEGRE